MTVDIKKVNESSDQKMAQSELRKPHAKKPRWENYKLVIKYQLSIMS